MHNKALNDRLLALRQLMAKFHIDAWLLMSADPHMSEYLPEHWKIREWLTGFTGSVGTIVITQDFAGLWVDGRYWVHAEQQLTGTGFVMQALSHDPTSTHLAWIEQHIAADATLAVDSQIIAWQQFQVLAALAKKKGFRLNTDHDLIAQIWQDRPALPRLEIWSQPEHIPAHSRAEKLAQLRLRLETKMINGHFISSLDDIAWLLNCRGQDVEFNPVFLAHLYINAERALLFIDCSKVSQALQDTLLQDHIECCDYNESVAFLSELSQQRILIDPLKVSAFHVLALQNNANNIVEDINPSTLLKSQKHPNELSHLRNAMRKDGVALCQFFAWLERHIDEKSELNELDIDHQLQHFRSQQADYIGASFATIAGFNANGALPHYRATESQYSSIMGDGLLLIDSGAQYLDGTTDITRVIAVGQASELQKRDYTLVLKSHIAMALACFPEGLAAPLLDAIARQPLWQHALDYRHGTGHGVGFALNVHEGPQVLSYYAPIGPYSALKESMIVSNEPGLYHSGQYGIRIENLVCIRKMESEQQYGAFLEFETLTLCPIHQQLIMAEMLDARELAWLNAYHAHVRNELAAQLEGQALDWLMRQTEAI